MSGTRRSYWGGSHSPAGDAFKDKLSVKRERLNSGGYTYGKYGRYFGTGQPLYCVESEDYEVTFFIRADHRASALAEARRCYPNAVLSGLKPKAEDCP